MLAPGSELTTLGIIQVKEMTKHIFDPASGLVKQNKFCYEHRLRGKCLLFIKISWQAIEANIIPGDGCVGSSVCSVCCGSSVAVSKRLKIQAPYISS